MVGASQVIREAIEKGNKEGIMSRANHYYLKAIAVSLSEILKIYRKNGVIPNFIIIDPNSNQSMQEET